MNRQQRIAARRNAGISRINAFLNNFERTADRLGIPPEYRETFLSRTLETLWNSHVEERMNKRLIIENEIKSLGIRLPNGTVRKSYHAHISLPTDGISDVALEGLEETGLTLTETSPGEYDVEGTPTERGDFNLRLTFSTVEGEPRSEILIPIAFNPDPRSIWKDLRSPQHEDGVKEDWASEYVLVTSDEGVPRKDIVAASIQGRSHAHEGRPRDDFFAAEHYDDSDWYVLAVADGAGSASLSWKGSEIACRTVIEHCRETLKDNKAFEEAIEAYNTNPETELRSVLTAQVTNIIYKGAVKAHEAINKESAENEGSRPRDYATTLMFAICKHFPFGWFIASFWVGDGAMCLYNEKDGTAKLLGTPDEGEFSGQTRFITMREIFHDKDFVSKRMRMTIVPDFTALLLMTDGVSDPLFETDNNLNDFNKWKEFMTLLKEGFPEDGIGGVDLSDDNVKAKDEMLGWLKFWRPGNHDDRTLVMLI